MDINLTAPINEVSYGYTSLNILKELVKMGHAVALFPIGPIGASKDNETLLRNCLNHQLNYSSLSPSIKIWHQNDLAHHVGKGLHVGFPIFELNNFKPVEKCQLQHQDAIFVTSSWAKDVVANHISKVRTFVVPLGVDRSIFNASIAPNVTSAKDFLTRFLGIPSNEAGLPNEDTAIFLNVGKTEKRKGHNFLVEVFNEAFTRHDNVELWLATHNVFYNEEQTQSWIDYCANSRLGHKIRVLPRFKTQNDLASVMMLTDCGVFPSRAEGWNLDLLEMMSLGKPVIATDYSAHTEFCNQDNCQLITVDELEVAQDGIWFDGTGGEWAKLGHLQREQLVEHMRSIHKLKSAHALGTNLAGIETAKKFSWTHSAHQFNDALLALS